VAGYRAVIVDLATGQIQRLDLAYHYDLHWSPDGNSLFYGKVNADDIVELTIYDLTQQTSRLLFEFPLEAARWRSSTTRRTSRSTSGRP
jgi:hypothetical protein